MSKEFKCKLCNLAFRTDLKLSKHKISKTHLDTINNIEIEPINLIKKKDTMETFNCDPYLNKNDVSKIENSNIGDGFDITFNNENVISCEYNHLEETHQEQNTDNVIEETIVVESEECFNKSITEKQSKIIDFLVKNQTHSQVSNKFFQALQKLELEHLKGLSIHIINCENIKMMEKQKFIKIFTIYKDSLLKKQSNGDTVFNNIPIQNIIDALLI
jgi:hypothetical protein